MKEWNFKKADKNCKLWMVEGADGVRIKVQIDNNEPFGAKTIDKGAVVFWKKQDMVVNGKILKVSGFNLEEYDEIKAYYENFKKEIKDRKDKEYRQEFNSILSGEKPLEMTYTQGENIHGFTATGISKDVIEYLHCGIQVGCDFWINREFKDGNIEKMKKHYEEWKEKDERRKKQEEEWKEEEKKALELKEKEKEKFLEGVSWDVEKFYEIDEGGKTPAYKHKITINQKTYTFYECNIFDYGRDIKPLYKISENSESGEASYKDGKWIWEEITYNGWRKIRDMTEDETHAYLIVLKYGYSSSFIRM